MECVVVATAAGCHRLSSTVFVVQKLQRRRQLMWLVVAAKPSLMSKVLESFKFCKQNYNMHI